MNGLYLLCFAIATILFRSDALPLVGEDGNREVELYVTEPQPLSLTHTAVDNERLVPAMFCDRHFFV